jgi:hypothetical protein
MQIPVFTGGLLSARQDEALLQANVENCQISGTVRKMLPILIVFV